MKYTEAETQERDEQAETLNAIRTGKRHKNATLMIDVCRKIMEEGQFARLHGTMIDHFSASAYCAVYNALSPESREMLEKFAANSPARAMGIVWKLIK